MANFLDDYIAKQPDLMPETDHEELWHLAGTVDALHRYCLELAVTRSISSYADEPLTEPMRMVCAIMGFADALAVKMVNKKGEANNDTVRTD